jgi:hypothetical protein
MPYNLRSSTKKVVQKQNPLIAIEKANGEKFVSTPLNFEIITICDTWYKINNLKVKENMPICLALMNKADMLEQNNENEYRVQAYRNAAGRVAALYDNLYTDEGFRSFRYYETCVKTNEFIERILRVTRFVKALEADYRVLFPNEWRKNCDNKTVEKAIQFIKAINKFKNRKNKRRYAAAESKLREVMNNVTDYSSWGKSYYFYEMSNIERGMALTVLQYLKKNGIESIKTYELACLENYCIE